MRAEAPRPGGGTPGLSVERVIGRVRGSRPGPTLLCIGGLHGNEPAGILALRRVLDALPSRGGRMAGDFVALAGNVRALREGRRFLDHDLNRAWTEEGVRAAGEHEAHGASAEDREQSELLAAIEEVVAAARGPVYVIDLHTTSGDGGAFSSFGDSLENRAFAARLPVPMILGLEELVEGTLLAYLDERGFITVAFESGQHEEPEAVERAEAAVWIGLAAARILPEHELPEAAAGMRRLRRDSAGVPRALEMLYRHDVTEEDGFVMELGYRNFQPVATGQAIARDRRGEIVVGASARVLMPLYQEQGEDGFFLVREFSPFWLHLSVVLRKLRLDRAVTRLPGVHRDPADPRRVVVNRRVARWYSLQLFHLLGFRKVEDLGSRLVVSRRTSEDGAADGASRPRLR